MKRILLLGLTLLTFVMSGFSQNVFDPADPIIRHDATKPYGSQQNPDTTITGLQKWVSRPTNGVSFGVDSYDASSFKQYFINIGSAKMAFRIKFPKSYQNPDSADKKYPVNIFLHGGGEVGCSTNGGIYNNERPLWLGGKVFMDFVDQNKFDGFLVYPQLVVSGSCFFGWGSAETKNYYAILAMIDSMAQYIRADIDRILVTGLSGGGYGAWRFAEAFPQRIAKIIPSASAWSAVNRTAFVHLPIWFGTGGKDLDPSPAQAQNTLNRMKDIGADIRYTVYPDRGHSMWYQHWREPEFAAEMNDMHKANPLVFFQRNEFCKPEDINARLGITAGFYAYEWNRDGSLIATSTGNTHTIINPAHVSTNTGNEIVVKSFGVYSVRFKRTSTSEWSEWSRKPAVVRTKDETVTLPIQVKGARSKVLPALDGSTTVPLTLADGFQNYRWYRTSNESQAIGTSKDYEAGVGEYKAIYDELYGCSSSFSPDFIVVDANGSPKPAPAQNLSAAPLSQQVTRLTWTGGAGETGYEIYRATASGGPYQFVAITAANATSFRDSNLVNNSVYYYVVRAVSETGASAASNETTTKTLTDNVPPSAPSNLAFTISSGPTAVNLTWTAATDNGKIERYDIFVNDVKLYSAPASGFVVSGLDSLIPYRFVVRAIDTAGNVSAPSNQVTYLPAGTPPGAVPAVPVSPSATAQSYTKISVSWSDESANETGFEIVRSTTLNGTYLPIATVPANTTSFSDSGLVSARQYFYMVRAIGEYGQSPYSAKVNATTAAAPATPVAPTSLAGIAENNGAISLAWTDNSSNETGFVVFRSTDNVTFTRVVTLPGNSNAYTDTGVVQSTSYYYYVVGRNAAGEGAASNTITMRAGNRAPEINDLQDMFVKATAVATEDFVVNDDSADIVTLTLINKPSFVTLDKISAGSYRFTAAPGIEHVGSYTVTVKAQDNNGKSSSKDFIIAVGEKNVRTIYVNFGAAGKTAPAPWNNWLGKRSAGDVISQLKDENNIVTPISINAANSWSGTTSLGHITGSNSGVFPDVVLESGLSDSTDDKQIRISGLAVSKRYNIVFVGSQNEGLNALASYSAIGQTVQLNARYNTDQTANLNSLAPDINGELLLTIKRIGSANTYLNGLVIEELEDGVLMLNPDNLYAAPADRNSVRLTWSDRTANETGFELLRATDSAFSKNVQTISIPANSTSYTNGALAPNTKYWYKIRAVGSGISSEYSKRVKVVTPDRIVYVNFNVTVEDAPAPWNNLQSAPMFAFTTPPLRDHAGSVTNFTLTLTREFNGEFTAGVNTGNNSGILPDNTLRSNYWLDKQQLGQFRLNGLNHSKLYRLGFVGSSSPPDWFKGNYTATYTVKGRTVYLNSWMNSHKVVYIGDVAPDEDGKVMLDFSTTAAAGYGFNAGLIIEEYDDISLQVPSDSIPSDTIPTNPPIDTIPDNPNPPIDTIPNNPDPPIDTIPDNPDPPIDTIPDNPDPPIDTIPDNPNPPIDTIPDTPTPPVDSTGESPYSTVTLYPNPLPNQLHSFKLKFYNHQATDLIDIEVFDQRGQLTLRKKVGNLPPGTAIVDISTFEAKIRTGVFLVVLKVNGKIVDARKLVKSQQ